MNPFRNRIFIFCIASASSSSIIANTGQQSEKGIKLYSGVIQYNEKQGQGVRATSSTSGIDLKLEIFNVLQDKKSSDSFSLFGNLTQFLNHSKPQTRFGLKSSKELKRQRSSFNLNLEGGERLWLEEVEGELLAEANGAGIIERHQVGYKAELSSRFQLTEMSEIRFDMSAGLQLGYAQGDRFKHLSGIKYEASRLVGHEVTLSRSYFSGERKDLGEKKETIDALEVISRLKIDEILQFNCKVGIGKVHTTARAVQPFYSGGCLADRSGPGFKQSLELARAIDKDFLTGDFIESDRLIMGLTRNVDTKDILTYSLSYFVDRDVGSITWAKKKRLDTSLKVLTQLNGLQGNKGLERPYALASVTWSFANSDFKRQSQLYQIGMGANFQ